MATKFKLSKSDGLIPNVKIKLEEEFIPEDLDPPEMEFEEFIPEVPNLQCASTEIDHSSADAETNVLRTHPCPELKTGSVVDQIFIDDTNDSDVVLYAQEDQPNAPVILDDQSNPQDLNQPPFTRTEGVLYTRPLNNNKDVPSHRRTQKTHILGETEGFPCSSCHKSFGTKNGLSGHMNIHAVRSHKCDICGKGFTQKVKLSIHMHLQHRDETQQPTPDDQNTRDANESAEAEESVEDLTSDQEFLDENAPSELADEQQARVSIAADCETCRFCKISFPKALIEAHRREVHSAFKCELCWRSFKKIYYLGTHMVTHDKERKREFACDSCPSAFYTKSDLARHNKGHASVTKSKECGTDVMQQSTLEKHLPYRHFGEALQFIAPLNSSNDGSLHAESELGKDRSGALMLDVRESQDTTIEVAEDQQSIISISESENESSEPSQNMNSPERRKNLKDGSEIHVRTRGARFECDQCPASFTKFMYFKRHLTIHDHNRRRDFTCHLCAAAFYTKSALKEHMEIHTGLTYDCVDCGAQFSRKATLRRHNRRFHTEDGVGKSFECPFCHIEFETWPPLSEHLKEHAERSCESDIREKLISMELRKAAANKCTPAKEVVISLDLDSVETETENSHSLGEPPTFHSSNSQTSHDISEDTNSAIMLDEEEFLSSWNDSDASPAAPEYQQSIFQVADEPLASVDASKKGHEKCEMCYMILPKKLMEFHRMSTHSSQGDNTFKCELCLRICTSYHHLKTHMKTHNEDRKREFTCHLCPRAYYTKGDLVRHSKIHAGITYNCELCDAHYSQKNNLKYHMIRRHSGATQQPIRSRKGSGLKFAMEEAIIVALSWATLVSCWKEEAFEIEEFTPTPQTHTSIKTEPTMAEEFLCDQSDVQDHDRLNLVATKNQQIGRKLGRGKGKQVNVAQRELIAVFMNQHHDLAGNKLQNNKKGRAAAERLWKELARKLNAIGPPIRKADNWKKSFALIKRRIKKKLSAKKKPVQELLTIAASSLEASVDGLPGTLPLGDPAVCLRTRAKQINVAQRELIAIFMDEHPNLAKNRLQVTLKGKAAARRLWQDLAGKLNAVGPPVKTAANWKKTYVDLKYRGKRKVFVNQKQVEELMIQAIVEGPQGNQLEEAVSASVEQQSETEDSDGNNSEEYVNEPKERNVHSTNLDPKLLLTAKNLKVANEAHNSMDAKLDKLIKIQERLLEIKEEKYKKFLELHKVKLELRTLQLKSLKAAK